MSECVPKTLACQGLRVGPSKILTQNPAAVGWLNIVRRLAAAECTAVAAIWLRMRMRILARPENALANCWHEISKKKLRIKLCELNFR